MVLLEDDWYWLTDSQMEEKKELGTDYTPFPPYLDKIFLEELERLPTIGRNNLKFLVKKGIPDNLMDDLDIGLFELAKMQTEEVKKDGDNYIFLIPEDRFYCISGDRESIYNTKNFRKDIRWGLYRMANGLEDTSEYTSFLKEIFREIKAEIYSHMYKIKHNSKNVH